MDPTTRLLFQGSAGAAEKVYVEDVFSTWLYTGNGSTQTITNGIDLSGKGGLVWRKARSSTGGNALIDSGQSWNGWLESNSTSANASPAAQFLAPQSTGFSITNGALANSSGVAYASWTFRKQAKFFDVVTWTGNSIVGADQTINHNLGSTPGCIIVKKTSAAQPWTVYHRQQSGTPENSYLTLNDTAAVSSVGSNLWFPSSTSFNADGFLGLNDSGDTYVAYLFAHDAGGFGDSGNDSIIKCGSYTGNGSTTGPVIDLGWEPQWLLVKRATGGTGDWYMQDNMRGWDVSGNSVYQFFANTSGAENFGSGFAIGPTGFAVTGNVAAINGNGNTYIYIAIRRGPMKTPTDATKVFKADYVRGTDTSIFAYLGYPADATILGYRNGDATSARFRSRLIGASYLTTSSTATETTSTAQAWDNMLGYLTTSGSVDTTFINWTFRRTPGFFDVVAYTGDGTNNRNVPHNLRVTPELVIYKKRSAAASWFVTHSLFSANEYLFLQGPGAKNTFSNTFGTPTSTNLVVSSATNCANDSSATYIAYLFATCPGVSKVGSYTGTGTTLSIDCGFTAGARFVLIKRTDSTGDWYVWDTTRGIISGNDPYLLLNSTAAEVTNTDYIDPLNAGFEISSTAPAAINANGGSYIYLAIA